MPVHDWSKVEAGVFHDFHHELITAVKHALNGGVLPPGYYAMADQVAGPGHPDVIGLERVTPDRGGSETTGVTGGAATAAPAVTTVVAEYADRRPARRKRVTVRHISGDNVVAVVEIVSPANKAGRGGLRAFAGKMSHYLEAGIHLLVVDLLRPGIRAPNGIHPLIWKPFKKRSRFTLPPDKPLTLAAYAAGDPARAFVEPVGVGERLPDMPLFLSPELHVIVPLEATYAAAWAMVPRRWRDELAPPA